MRTEADRRTGGQADSGRKTSSARPPVRPSAYIRILLLALAVLPLLGQRRDRRTPRPSTDFSVNNVRYDGHFAFVRFRFTPHFVGWPTGNSYFGADFYWDHDYPRGETHLSEILRELTLLKPHPDGTNIFGAEDDELFKYPITYVSEPGYWTMTSAEAARVRAYILKGGFLIFDDFRDRPHWDNFVSAIGQVLPEGRLVRLNETNAVFQSFFVIESLDATGQPYGLPTEFWGMYEDNDPRKRLLFVANYNNDIGEAWEYSGTGYVPIDLANETFKLGVNYMIYGLTH